MTSEKEKKKSFYFMFCLHFLFIYFCLQYSKLKKKKKQEKKIWHWPIKKEKKNWFKIQNSRKKRKEKGESFVGYIYFDKSRSSHWAEISSQETISRSEPLSHWVAIRAIEPWSDQAKSRSTSSYNLNYRASEPRSELSSRDTSQTELSHIF